MGIDAVSLSGPVRAPQSVASRLDRLRTTSDGPDGVPLVSGYVGTLRATLKADRLRLHGSLPEYLGEQTALSRSDVERARLSLSDRLGEDLGDLAVWRLELTADLPLARPVAAYLPLLVRRERFQRVEYEGETVGFYTKARRVVFYDKVAERRRQKKAPPPGNVLRVEVQFRKRLRRQLGFAGPVLFSELHAPEQWSLFAARWLAEYEAVEKGRAPLPFDETADVKRGLALAGLSAVGRPGAEAMVRSAHEAGAYSRSTMHNRLRWVRDLASDPALTLEDSRITELDAAARAAADPA